MLSTTEREELEMLRRSAAMFMTDHLDKACFQLEGILERNHVNPTIRLMANIILLMKNEIRKDK